MPLRPTAASLRAPAGVLLALGLAACGALDPLPPPDTPKQLTVTQSTPRVFSEPPLVSMVT